MSCPTVFSASVTTVSGSPVSPSQARPLPPVAGRGCEFNRHRPATGQGRLPRCLRKTDGPVSARLSRLPPGADGGDRHPAGFGSGASPRKPLMRRLAPNSHSGLRDCFPQANGGALLAEGKVRATFGSADAASAFYAACCWPSPFSRSIPAKSAQHSHLPPGCTPWSSPDLCGPPIPIAASLARGLVQPIFFTPSFAGVPPSLSWMRHNLFSAYTVSYHNVAGGPPESLIGGKAQGSIFLENRG
jgi:hypothetical protein